MIRHATEDTARRAVAHWVADEAGVSTLRFLGRSGITAWAFGSADGTRRVLRLVDPEHRSRPDVEAELAFVRHLARRGTQVAEPVPANDGGWTVVVDRFVASAVRFVAGDEVAAPAPGTDRDWGRALALLHEAANGYAGPSLGEWHEDRWLARADRLLPVEDGFARAEWARLQARLGGLPRDRDAYGTIHGDHGPQNFRRDRETGTLITFDFGNACRHWFAMDVVIALSTLLRDPGRDRRRADLLAGYRSVRALDPESWAAWPDFLGLRLLYVYLSRLDAFGPSPDGMQKATLARLRELVRRGAEWPPEAA